MTIGSSPQTSPGNMQDAHCSFAALYSAAAGRDRQEADCSCCKKDFLLVFPKFQLYVYVNEFKI